MTSVCSFILPTLLNRPKLHMSSTYREHPQQLGAVYTVTCTHTSRGTNFHQLWFKRILIKRSYTAAWFIHRPVISSGSAFICGPHITRVTCSQPHKKFVNQLCDVSFYFFSVVFFSWISFVVPFFVSFSMTWWGRLIYILLYFLGFCTQMVKTELYYWGLTVFPFGTRPYLLNRGWHFHIWWKCRED